MTNRRKNLGRLGEELARKLLEKKGYRFLRRNFLCRFGEIDLIFQDGNCLVIVEVKTRFSGEYGCPEESITPRKIRSLKKAIDYFYLQYPRAPKLCRIDAIAIELDVSSLKPIKVKHLQNISQ